VTARVEQEIQKAVFAHIAQRGVRGAVAWHTPNGMFAGGGRNRKGVAIQGAIMKGMGMRAGVSDILAVYGGKIFAMELKAPGGRPTPAQLQFLADMEAAGAITAVCEGLDAALRTLEGWGLLGGRTV
jgi:hypothetical protein